MGQILNMSQAFLEKIFEHENVIVVKKKYVEYIIFC